MVPSPLNDWAIFFQKARQHPFIVAIWIRAVAVSDHFYPLGWRHPAATSPNPFQNKPARSCTLALGHFDRYSELLLNNFDPSVLGNQPRKEELMNSSSRFGFRYRRGFEFCRNALSGASTSTLVFSNLKPG